MLGYNRGNWGGINYNSPTVQNFMNPPNGYYYNQPQQIGNIGGLGYNPNIGLGGYYSGSYQYYDPMEIRRLEEERQKQEKEALDNYIEIQKLKARLNNTYNGIDYVTDEYLEKYYNPNTYASLIRDSYEYNEMCRLANVSLQAQPIDYGAYSRMEQIYDANTRRHPKDQSLQEFLDTAGEEIRLIMQKEAAREKRKNVRNMYDHESFNQLANMHRSSFASLRENVTVDDMTVELPSHLRNSYQERKRAFMAHLMNDPRNG